MQVTHHNTLGALKAAFLQGPSSAGLGQGGNTDIASNIDALSAELAHSELTKLGGASNLASQSAEKVGLTIPDNSLGTRTLLDPDQRPDQNQLLLPHHH